MLADEKLFNVVEEWLRENGHIERFEKECGPIKGRIMITRTKIPEGIDVKDNPNESAVAFEASFDFYDTTPGIAVFLMSRKAASDVWVTAQVEGAESPSRDWVEFFIKTLFSNIGEDGSYGIPIYSLVNDTADLTVVPDDPNAEPDPADSISNNEYFCTNCGAILNAQEGFTDLKEVWKCKACGYENKISADEIIDYPLEFGDTEVH